MNLNSLGAGKQLISRVLAQPKVKQWTRDQRQRSQTTQKNIIKPKTDE